MLILQHTALSLLSWLMFDLMVVSVSVLTPILQLTSHMRTSQLALESAFRSPEAAIHETFIN